MPVINGIYVNKVVNYTDEDRQKMGIHTPSGKNNSMEQREKDMNDFFDACASIGKRVKKEEEERCGRKLSDDEW